MIQNDKQFSKTTMELAKDVQVRYGIMGSPCTQNIRNPFPMKTLVANELPNLPGLDTPLEVTQQVKYKISMSATGKYFIKTMELRRPASEVLGYSFWEKNAVSQTEIFDKLVAKGYIVRWNSVSQALVQLRKESNLKSLRFNLPKGNYSYCRYFFQKS